MTGEIARVEWIDSTSDNGWQDEEEAARRDCVVIVTWGRIIDENEERVALASSYAIEGPGVMDVQHIPRACVLQIEIYEVEI